MNKAKIAFVVLGVLLLAVVIGLVVYFTKKPKPPGPDPSSRAKGKDSYEIVPVTPENVSRYLVKRAHATISPSIVYRVKWDIEEPAVADGTEYTVTVEASANLCAKTTNVYKTKEKTLDINPLTFACDNVNGYTVDVKVEFTQNDKLWHYNLIYFGGVNLPYTITDVSSPFQSTVHQQFLSTKPPVFNYGNSWTRLPRENFAIRLDEIALSSTDRRAKLVSDGMITSENNKLFWSTDTHEEPGRYPTPFMIPRFDVSPEGSSEIYRRLQDSQKNFPDYLYVQPFPGQFLYVSPDISTVRLTVDFHVRPFNKDAIIRVTDIVTLVPYTTRQ